MMPQYLSQATLSPRRCREHPARDDVLPQKGKVRRENAAHVLVATCQPEGQQLSGLGLEQAHMATEEM